MKKIASTIICFLFLISCGIKKNQGLLNTGNYDEVIDNSIESLRYNKEKKANQDYIYLLEEAFAKAKERDLNSINLWKKENHPSNFEKIYNTYLALNDRQEKIKPLLPLKLLIEGRNAIFPFENYNENIIKSKNSFCDFLYTNATFLLSTTDKMNFRRAHDELLYLNQLNPNYKNVNTLIRESLNKGTDYINVSTINETNMVIPVRLLNDLLDFSTYGLNNKWTVFETTKQKGIKYDYAMIINFRDIIISPEQIKEREFIKERQIIDGQRKLLDANGKEVYDNNRKVVMIDNVINTNISIYESRQLKTCQIQAKVDYINLKNNQLIETFPIASEFVFDYIYSTFKGDRRAVEDNYLPYFNRRSVPFPSNEQMVYDTGENLKIKIKSILTNNLFRN